MTLGDWLIHGRTLTPPGIWGKLPAHGDFVRHRMRRGEGSAWQAWLGAEGGLAAANNPRATQVPIAFVLPPGTLPFAKRAFVLGAMLASRDRVGRPSPLLLYQAAHPRWMSAYLLELARAERGPMQDWLFYLTRLLAWHASRAEPSRLTELAHALDAAWRRRAPGVPAALDLSHLHDHAARLARMPLDFGLQEPGFDARWDPAGDLQGAQVLPWADWPQRQLGAPAASAFWQQDADGGFIATAEHLQDIWNEQPAYLASLRFPLGQQQLTQ